MLDLLELTRLEMESRGIKKYSVKPIQIEVTEPYMILNLNKYVYLFCSKSVDTPALPTRIDLKSSDNLFQFTKTTLENSNVAQYQFFSESLTINTANYGSNKPSEFMPYMLEFLKIIPETEA